MNNGQVLKTYKVAIGKGDAAAKEREGDQRTPEGEYVVDEKKDVTCCFLALHLSYPNASDIEHARMLGVDPGGAIEIHGLPKKRAWLGRFHRIVDWTSGCIALTNSEMLELWPFVAVNTPVEIDP